LIAVDSINPGEQTMAVLSLQNVTYKYPADREPVLKNISLQVERESFWRSSGQTGLENRPCAIPSLALCRIFTKASWKARDRSGLETHSSTLSEWVTHAGLVFQNPFNQITGAKYTVFEEIAFGLENTGVPRDEMKRRVEVAMALTGISDLADRSPYSLVWRAAAARGPDIDPGDGTKVIVLDEPTSQMDPIGTREVFQVIKGMSERGMTVVMVEHKMEWIAAFADRVIALADGEILTGRAAWRGAHLTLLAERGFGLSRYTQVAREAQRRALARGSAPAGDPG
jgi:energy-coupling factor transport system ATP-binding protein